MDSLRLRDFIDLAIDQEVQAAKLYRDTAAKALNRDQREFLEHLALVESGLEKKLKDFKKGDSIGFTQLDTVVDLKLSDFLIEVEIGPASSIQDILIYAMKKEQKSFELYDLLAGIEFDPDIKKFFASLGAEEKSHKYDFEKQYDAMVLREN